MSDRLDLAEQALREALGYRLDGLMPALTRNAARRVLEAAGATDADRLDLVKRGLRRGWNAHKEGIGQAAIALRLDDLARGVVGGVEDWREMPAAESQALFAGEKAARLADPQFRCPEHDAPMVEGKCPQRRCRWKIETLDAPRVTREMVLGATLGRNAHEIACALCGASVATLQEGPQGDLIERHRAWHDRLERLLETRP